MTSVHAAGMFAVQSYREMKTHQLVFMVAIRVQSQQTIQP